MPKPQRILLIRLKSMGDVVFTLPAVHAIRASAPDAQITFLVSKEYRPLLNGFREVNNVIELDRERFRGLHPIRIAKETFGLISRMRKEKVHLAVDLQGYGETALLALASGAPDRWGTVYRQSRSWAYTQAVPRRWDVHPAEDYLLLLRRNGLANGTVRNEFIVPAEAMSEAAEFLTAHGLSRARPILFIQPFTSSPEKNWPLNRYLEVANFWKAKGWQMLFGGGPGDSAALEAPRSAGYAVAAGVPVMVSAALASASSLVLGADTGLVHLAVAMGKRVIMIMRSPFSGSTHPFQHPDWAIHPPNKGSLDTISSEAVNEECAKAAAQLGIGAPCAPKSTGD